MLSLKIAIINTSQNAYFFVTNKYLIKLKLLKTPKVVVGIKVLPETDENKANKITNSFTKRMSNQETKAVMDFKIQLDSPTENILTLLNSVTWLISNLCEASGGGREVLGLLSSFS